MKHNVFISYHHDNDQDYKEKLLKMNSKFSVFIDKSVDTGDISDDLSDESIRSKIRDEYLRESTVTILLAGTETAKRKHIDWELYSSMIDGKINKKSGIVVINLPSVNCNFKTATHDEEKEVVYPDIKYWDKISSRKGYTDIYPHLPDRIIDNLVNEEAKISVCSWDIIYNNPDKLVYLLNKAYNSKDSCKYDLSRSMRRRDY